MSDISISQSRDNYTLKDQSQAPVPLDKLYAFGQQDWETVYTDSMPPAKLFQDYPRNIAHESAIYHQGKTFNHEQLNDGNGNSVLLLENGPRTEKYVKGAKRLLSSLGADSLDVVPYYEEEEVDLPLSATATKSVAMLTFDQEEFLGTEGDVAYLINKNPIFPDHYMVIFPQTETSPDGEEITELVHTPSNNTPEQFDFMRSISMYGQIGFQAGGNTILAQHYQVIPESPFGVELAFPAEVTKFKPDIQNPLQSIVIAGQPIKYISFSDTNIALDFQIYAAKNGISVDTFFINGDIYFLAFDPTSPNIIDPSSMDFQVNNYSNGQTLVEPYRPSMEKMGFRLTGKLPGNIDPAFSEFFIQKFWSQIGDIGNKVTQEIYDKWIADL